MSNISIPKIIALSFIVLILCGTVLLTLPISSQSGHSLGIIDALFTITSGSCVTGLSLFDIHSTLTLFGQIVLLVCIQMGGLGLITFAGLVILSFRKNLGYQEAMIVKEGLNQSSIEGIKKFIVHIFMLVFFIEGAGTLLLFLSTIRTLGFTWTNFYFSIFHAISAFCNAGFSLFSDNLSSQNGNVFEMLTIASLIILGGLGFAVLDTLWAKINGKKAKFNASQKLAIRTTIILLVVGTLLTYLFEFSNPATLGPLSESSKWVASFFQSVTTRTAGFNSVNIGGLSQASIFLFMILMFIGASPGSTGGGIKTTTLGVLVATLISVLKNRDKVVIYKRTIPHRVVYGAIAILFLSLLFIFIITLLILIVQPTLPFISVLFEVISAFATVGLSLGITAKLCATAKVLLVVTMLTGRIGPITFALFLTKKRGKSPYEYPEESVIIG
ncbi:MAG: hypothetical protein NTX05_04445 [Fusobacteria bacterium]|nr:hypothetical protein [Fusobacteriota bacterium]